ncbi:LPS O-antigen length regulator [Enterobacteriaceae bacterium 89]|nr:LPS O-antigen length regulator [Enterobacteriaceae bacterium 89]
MIFRTQFFSLFVKFPGPAMSLSELPLPARQENDIDLTVIVERLLAVKKQLTAATLGCALFGLMLTFILPQKWTSRAEIIPPDQVQLAQLRNIITPIQAMNVDIKETRNDIFMLYVKELSSRSQFENWLLSSPQVLEKLTTDNRDAEGMHQAIVAMADAFKVTSAFDSKHVDDQPFKSWTLSFTDRQPEQAQRVLKEYTRFISAKVQEDVIALLKSKQQARIGYEKEKLSQTREALNSVRDAKIQQLKYALQIATAAGIKKPIYSEGQVVNDDPDFAVSLGTDGLRAKLEVEKSLSDVSSISADLRNREIQLKKLSDFHIPQIEFPPAQFLLSPTLPVKHDGPGRLVVVLLSGCIGLMLACGYFLLHQAMADRH